MIERKPLDDGAGVELTFVVSKHHASGPVGVAGDFNGWDPAALTLQEAGGDMLVASVEVPFGRRYAFRYFADDAWFNDEGADDYEPNEFGGHNCVVDLTEG